MSKRFAGASKYSLIGLLAGGILAGCSSGAGPGVAPVGPQVTRMSSSSVPVSATIDVTTVIYSPTQRSINMTLTYGSAVINATCQRLAAKLVGPPFKSPTTFHSDRICTATSGGTGTISIRWDGISQSVNDPFIFTGSGNIYAGTQDFKNLNGEFSVTGTYYFQGNFPENDSEVWTGQVVLAPS